MKNILKNLWSFWADETGQSTTEYILILSVVVMVAMKFKGTFQGVMSKATDKLGTNIEGALDQNAP